jgi:hypothetical protein
MYGKMFADAETASDAKAAAKPPHFTASTTLASYFCAAAHALKLT